MNRLAWGIPAAMRIQGSPAPLAVGIFLIGAVLALAAAPAARATTMVDGYAYPFDDNAFADHLYSYTGTWYGGGEGIMSLEDVLVGSDPENLAYCYGSECQATLLFMDNAILDLEGPDLAVFELGLPANGVDTFAVRIAGVTNNYQAVDTGLDVDVLRGTDTFTYDLLVALIDLGDFDPEGPVTMIDLFPDPLDINAPADFTVIASMNIVPEPSSVLLVGLGLAGLAINGRRPRA